MATRPRFARRSQKVYSHNRTRPRALLRVELLEDRQLLSASAPDSVVAFPLGKSGGGTTTTSLPPGFSPARVRHAYGFDQVTFSSGTVKGDGTGQTIAIVDAYDDPNIASDLAAFDKMYALPAPPAFTKVNQTGGTSYPFADASWAMEIALDVEWAHAVAPGAKILLVEANSSYTTDLLTAVDYARNQPGVVAVSMSWGSGEFLGETSYDYHFTTPTGHIGGSGLPGGVTFVAASGDSGAGVLWPAAAPTVLAVGGTTLTADSTGTYKSEAGWSGSGGGTSAYESEPGYQATAQTTGKRSTPDVSFNADPNTGYAVYDTVPYNGMSGWLIVGGTSAAAPQWAALVAIADQGRALAGKGSLGNAQANLYGLAATDFHDVATGSNGAYTAVKGYDLVTGRGSPFANYVVRDLVAAAQTAPLATTASSGTSKPNPKMNRGTAADDGGVTARDDAVLVATATSTADDMSLPVPVADPARPVDGASGHDAGHSAIGEPRPLADATPASHGLAARESLKATGCLEDPAVDGLARALLDSSLAFS